MTDLQGAKTFVPKAIPHLLDTVIVRGEGAYLWDQNGKRYLDFTSGVGVTNTGHCHPRVVAAIREQAGRLLHLHQNTAYHEPGLRLVQALREILPAKMDGIYFANSGAEAVEGAVKLARQATKKPNIIGFQGGFHGRTIGTMSLTASKTIYRAGYQPLMPGVFFAPYAYCYRCPKADANPEKFGFDKDCNWALEQVEFLLASQTAPDETAAILAEPVLGEGGYIVPPARFLKGLREICDKHKILLILDEIQSGFGRTGKLFAFEHFGVLPDIMIMAKGLASGTPLSAIAAHHDVWAAAPAGSHGGTYGGNALACAAGVASLAVYREEKLVENAAALGAKLLARLKAMKEKDAGIGDVRGLGLMVGVEFVKPGGKVHDKERANAVKKACIENGFLILTCGTYDNIIRWIPPLVITEADLEEGLKIFEGALKKTATA